MTSNRTISIVTTSQWSTGSSWRTSDSRVSIFRSEDFLTQCSKATRPTNLYLSTWTSALPCCVPMHACHCSSPTQVRWYSPSTASASSPNWIHSDAFLKLLVMLTEKSKQCYRLLPDTFYGILTATIGTPCFGVPDGRIYGCFCTNLSHSASMLTLHNSWHIPSLRTFVRLM